MRWPLLLVAACGRLGFDPMESGGVDAPGSAGGTSSIVGLAPDGMPFVSVAAAYVIGHPQFAGQTSIYLLSNPIACSELAAPGWGQRIAAGTQCLELVLGGSAVALYTVRSSDPPRAKDGASHYRFALGNGEYTAGGSSGQVTLTGIGSDGSNSGEFTVAFSQSSGVVGTFHAAYCDVGMSP
jgi:hypothetical protein